MRPGLASVAFVITSQCSVEAEHPHSMHDNSSMGVLVIPPLGK